MFSKEIFNDLIGLVKVTDEKYSKPSTVFKLVSNSIESYVNMIKEVREGRLSFISLTDEDKEFLRELDKKEIYELSTDLSRCLQINEERPLTKEEKREAEWIEKVRKRKSEGLKILD